MIYAEVLAGGSGKRFGDNDLPKQYQMLGTRPIIIHTLEQFIISPEVKAVVVCTPEAWIDYTTDIIDKYIPDSSKVIVTAGGSTRNESVMAGCRCIEQTFGLNADDVVITHDAVRPFVTQRIISDNIAAIKTADAVDTCIPATDTIVESVQDKIIAGIPNREFLYAGQTPQTFRISDLMHLYEELTAEEKDILTDACKIFVMKGKKVKIVPGETFNLKITTVFDLKLANAILTVTKK